MVKGIGPAPTASRLVRPRAPCLASLSAAPFPVPFCPEPAGGYRDRAIAVDAKRSAPSRSISRLA
eukprot:5414067-Pyramimonas_sp.AAC.1